MKLQKQLQHLMQRDHELALLMRVRLPGPGLQLQGTRATRRLARGLHSKRARSQPWLRIRRSETSQHTTHAFDLLWRSHARRYARDDPRDLRPPGAYVHTCRVTPTNERCVQDERAGETKDDINSGGRYRVWRARRVIRKSLDRQSDRRRETIWDGGHHYSNRHGIS